MIQKITVFAPATVANVACGFDVLGFALDAPGDIIEMWTTSKPGVYIRKILGAENLPLASKENVAGVAVEAMLSALGENTGLEMIIQKGIKPGSGIGSSAASAAAAVFAANIILGKPFTKTELVQFAMEGEVIASGSKHADNVAPSLLGGFVLVRGYEPLDIVALPAPEELYCAVIHPQIEIKTSESRMILPKDIPLKTGIKQWGNLAGLVAGLHQSDFELIGRSLIDVVAEPYRSGLIPGFAEIKKAAMGSGALGCSISGSGPSIFALTKGEESAKNIANAMGAVADKLGMENHCFASAINMKGAVIIESSEEN